MCKVYKNTIRLPKTNFPMKANLSLLTDKIINNWLDVDIYNKLREKNLGKHKFILHDGPPYANGNIHLGTALNKILKDIIIKGRNLLGYDAPLVFGWDCHGLPIEWKVEENFKKSGKKKEEVDVIEFRNECRNFAYNWIKIQKDQFKTLGIVADFKHPYITMDFKSEALIYKEITKFILNKNIYLGKKPVMWSVIEKTALAEAEIEYINKISDALFAGFKVVKANKNIWLNALAVIWTTTPWTLPGNQAIAYNPNIKYGLYLINSVTKDSNIKVSSKIILAVDQAEILLKKFLVTSYTLLDSSIGLESFFAEHPMKQLGFENIVPFLRADFVDTSVGTGLVHIAPAYGLDDFYLAKSNNITPLDIINNDGTYKTNIPLLANKHIFKVAYNIIEILKNCNTLVYNEKITHSYPCSWRSKAPLIYRLTKQWFLSLDCNNLRSKVLDTIKNDIRFFPEISQNRLYSMVLKRPDWCLSRQRIWGVPLAMFVHKDTEELLIDQDTYDNIYNTFLTEGSDAWFKGDPKRFLSSSFNKDDYLAVMDIVDVWFDSGCSHVYVLRENKNLSIPADIYFEGTDQHRGWFQASLIESIASFGDTPCKNILTHGFVLDEKGQKMSKSLNNVINPLEVIDKYGLDVLRLWVANSDYQLDVRASESIFKQQTDVYRKIRNTLRYMLGNLTYFNEHDIVDYVDLPELEKFVLHQVYLIHKSFENCFLNNYTFHSFFSELYNFISIDLSAFYFDIRKDILYCDSSNSKIFKSCLTVMNILFDYLVKWLSPFITITAEEAFLERYNNDSSILLENITSPLEEWKQPELFNKYIYIKEVRKAIFATIEEARINKLIGSSLEAEPIVYVCEDKVQLLKSVDLASICVTSGVIVKSLEELENNYDHFIKVEFRKKTGTKCKRCWKIDSIDDDLCKRCSKVVNE